MSTTRFHFQLGATDVAPPAGTGTDKVIGVQLIPGQQTLGHCLGSTLDEVSMMGATPTEIGIDMLLLGTAVLTVDKSVGRGQAEDGWTRELVLSLPVSDCSRWISVAPQISTALAFLTGDRWTLEFRPRPLECIALAGAPEGTPVPIDCIALLSGGLDSFIGGIDLLAAGKQVLFVSHSAVKTDSWRQRKLVRALSDAYPAKAPAHLRASIQVRARHLAGKEIEETERSRSFLFFSAALVAASAFPAVGTIVVPENGLISLNVPLEELRLGALSTRTTHPYFLARMNEIIGALGFNARLHNPYQYHTKGEMVRRCANPVLLGSKLAETISCSSPNNARIQFGVEQCGYCVPCLIRRAALINGPIPDTTVYGIPNLAAKPLRSDQKPGEHVRACQAAIARLNDSALRAGIIVHESGPLSDYPAHYADFAGVYFRGMKEIATLLASVTTRPHA